MPPSVDFNPVPLLQPMVGAFGLVHTVAIIAFGRRTK